MRFFHVNKQFKQLKIRPILVTVPAAVALLATAWAEEAERHSHALEEITVTATPLKRSAEELAQPTAVLTGEALARKQTASLGETLSEEAGVSSTYFGPIASRPVIRGQSGERVRVLQDSLDSLDVSALSEDHQVALEGILTERVEIVRGPATLLYGSGASGGLVNVIDNRIAQEPLEKPFTGKLAVSLDSATDGRAVAGRIDGGNQGAVFHFDFARRLSGNVAVPGFVESARQRAGEGIDPSQAERDLAENTDGDSTSGAASLSFVGDFGFIGLALSNFDSNYGVPGAHGHDDSGNGLLEPDLGSEAEEFVRIGVEQTRIDLKGRYAFDSTIEEARLRVGRNDYTHTEFEGAETGTRFSSKGIEVRLELSHKPLAGWQGAIGLQRKSVNFDAVGEEAFVPPSETIQSSVFLFEEKSLGEKNLLQAGARLEHQSLRSAALPDMYSKTAYAASVGLIHDFAEWGSAAANLSRSERHPNATELFAAGPHVALSRYELGAMGQGLSLFAKETTTGLDLTFKGTRGRWQWSLTGFMSKVDDYIFAAPTGAELDDLPVFAYRQADAEFYGYEAQARVELHEGEAGHLHAHLFSDFVYGEEHGDGPYLPRLPPLRFGFGLDYAGDRLAAGLRVTRYQDQDKTASGEFPSDAYTLVSAELDYHFDTPGLWGFVKGTNLTDAEARQHTSPVKEFLPLPGRGLHAGLRYEF